MTAQLNTTIIQNASSSTPNITLDTVGNASFGGMPYGTSSFLRNRLINGAFAIDQRNAGSSQTVTTSGAYTVDRWYVVPTGASVTSQQKGSVGANTLQITGASSVSAVNIYQRIESQNIADLASQSVTLSVTLSSSTLTSIGVYVVIPSAQDNYTSTSSTTITSSQTISSTATRYTFTFTMPSGATNGAEILFTTGSFTSGTLTFSNAQLEPGTVATPFERRQYGEELMLAQRYYCKTFSQGTAPANNTTTTGALRGTARIINTSGQMEPAANWKFPATMRASPTVTLYSSGTGSTNAQWNNDGSTSYSSNARTQFIGDSNVDINNAGTVLTSGVPWQIHATADAEL